MSTTRARRGDANRDRRDRGSGPNIPEAQRHTVRVRLRRDDHELAAELATELGCTVPEAIARGLRLLASVRGSNLSRKSGDLRGIAASENFSEAKATSSSVHASATEEPDKKKRRPTSTRVDRKRPSPRHG